jgi:hypothetical protein
LKRKVIEAGFSIEKCSYFILPTVPYLLVRGRLERLLRAVAKRDDGASFHAPLRPFVNACLERWLALEGAILERAPLPFGGSLLVIARKP